MAAPVAVVALKEVHMSALLHTWPPTLSVSEFADEIGGSIGAALKAGKADLNSCKLSHCCIAAGVDLSSSAHGRGAHGDEKLTSKDGAVFLSTPGEWQAALQARLGAPHHCKDVAAVLSRTGILIHGGALLLLHSGAKHELEGFAGDAWLFELPSERGQGAKKQPRSSRSPQRSVAADGHGGR